MTRLLSLLLLIATSSSIWAQMGNMTEPKKTNRSKLQYQNIVATEFHFYPSYRVDKHLNGETNVGMMSTLGGSLNYTGRFLFGKERHALEIGIGAWVHRTGVKFSYLDDNFPMRNGIIRLAFSGNISHNIYFLKKKKTQFYASYGMRMLYIIGDGDGSFWATSPNNNGTENHISANAIYYGNPGHVNSKPMPFVPLIDMGIGVELASKKGFRNAFVIELHFALDFIAGLSHATYEVEYYEMQIQSPFTRTDLGSGSLRSHLSNFSLKLGKKF